MEEKSSETATKNVRPSPRNARKLQRETSSKLKWNNVNAEVTRSSLATPSLNIKDYDPVYALRKIAMLYEKNNNEEVANIIKNLSADTLLQIYKDFPIDLFMRAIPQSLGILDALYSRLYEHSPKDFPTSVLLSESLVMHIMKLYARNQSQDLPKLKNWETIQAHCKSVLKIIGHVDGTSTLKMLRHRRSCLHRAVESLGKHGLVEVEITPSDQEIVVKKLLSLKEALEVEVERMIVNSKCAIHKLSMGNRRNSDFDVLLGKPKHSIKSKHQQQHSQRANAPSECGHQRMLELTSSHIQKRLYQNKSVLNAVDPLMQYAQLPWLLNILQERIERDKDVLLTFSQLRKEVPSIPSDAKLSQVLLHYTQAFTTVIDIVKKYVENDPGTPELPPREEHRSKFKGTWSKPPSEGSCKSSPATVKKSPLVAKKPEVDATQEKKQSNNPQDQSAASKEACQNCARMKNDVHRAQHAIEHLKKREKDLIRRLSKQAESFISKSSNFENIEEGTCRPTDLVWKYHNLYSEGRVQAFDAIDEILQKDEKNSSLDRINDVKCKLLFSVIVLSFRSVTDTLDNIIINMRQLLCMSRASENPATKSTETTILTYLRSTADTYDVTENFEEVFNRVCDALYECPELRTSASLKSYVSECVRLAWLLSVQMPPYTIEYDATYFDSACHERFHTSDNTSEEISSFLWPSLLEKQSGRCISKGIVVTGY